MELGLYRMRRLHQGRLCRGFEDAWSWQEHFYIGSSGKVVDSVLSGAELCRVVPGAGRWKKADVKERSTFSALEGGASHLIEHLGHSGSTWSWGGTSAA